MGKKRDFFHAIFLIRMRGFCPYCYERHITPHDTNSYFCTSCNCIFVIEKDEVVSKYYDIDRHGRRFWHCQKHKIDDALWKSFVTHVEKLK